MKTETLKDWKKKFSRAPALVLLSAPRACPVAAFQQSKKDNTGMPAAIQMGFNSSQSIVSNIYKDTGFYTRQEYIEAFYETCAVTGRTCAIRSCGVWDMLPGLLRKQA